MFVEMLSFRVFFLWCGLVEIFIFSGFINRLPGGVFYSKFSQCSADSVELRPKQWVFQACFQDIPFELTNKYLDKFSPQKLLTK